MRLVGVECNQVVRVCGPVRCCAVLFTTAVVCLVGSALRSSLDVWKGPTCGCAPSVCCECGLWVQSSLWCCAVVCFLELLWCAFVADGMHTSDTAVACISVSELTWGVLVGSVLNAVHSVSGEEGSHALCLL
jgi:hypothetical protein